MSLQHSPSTAVIAGRSVHAMFVPLPIACFTLALLTDIAFWQTSNLMWQYFSEWLLFAGLVFGAVAALAHALEFLLRPELRARREAWFYAIGGVIVLVLAVVNSLVHAGDGWTAVVPYGLGLSAVTVLVMLVTAWLDRSMVLRHDVEGTRYE